MYFPECSEFIDEALKNGGENKRLWNKE
jgi:hypothetical protein